MSEKSKSYLNDAVRLDNENVMTLLMHLDWKGYGIYCALLQLLETQPDGTLTTDYDILSHHLQTDCQTVESVVEKYSLFGFETGSDGERRFYSVIIRRQAERRAQLSAKRAESAAKRWKRGKNVASSAKQGRLPLEYPHAEAVAEKEDKNGNHCGKGDFNMVAGRALMLEDTEWFDKLSERYSCNRETMKRLFNVFVDNLEMNGGGVYPSGREAMTHFFNWLNKDYANKMLTRFMAEEKNRKETEKREREQAEQKAARERHARECVTYEEYCRRNNIPTSGSLARDLERRI